MISSDLGGPDIAGLAGVAMMVFAYAASALGRLDPTRATALVLNLIGSALVIYSLTHAWNVSSFVMEAVWFLVAAVGLVRLAMKRR
jgi:hypothetical protein